MKQAGSAEPFSDLHKQAVEALRQSEEKYRNLFDRSNDGIVIHDLQGAILDVNQKALDQLGYSKSELLSLVISDLHPPEALETSRQAFEDISRDGFVYFEIDFKKKNGESFPAEVSSSLFEIGGEPVIQGIVRDITSRRQAQQALRESHERFLTVLDSIDAHIYAADLETYEILYTNGRMQDDFGNDAIGETCWKVFRDEPGPCTTCPNEKLIDANGNPTGVHTWEGQNPITGKWYMNYDRAIKWVDGRLARLQVAIDITERRLLEDQLRQAHKMEAVGRLAGGVAHDFNNLLTAINGFAELMRLQLPPDDPLQELVAKILGSGRRAADLVRQLLAFSRKQIIQPRLVNLNEVVAEMNKMLQRTLGEHILMETVLAPGLWSVKMDPAQIEQIIVNLGVNARDAMPGGGRLVIETANVVVDETYAPYQDATERLDLQPGEYVLLSVSDTGAGMDQEVKDHIFEPFFTTKGVGEGTGLGLSSVYGVAKQNGGDIQVQSKHGRGTTFRIYLPRARADTATHPRPVPADDLPCGTETVLLVEDEPTVRELAAHVLRRQGYTVLETGDGEQALRLAQEHGTDIHLLLTDVVMPRMSGKELASRLEVSYPAMRILFTSGHMDETIIRHRLPRRDAAFIHKPFTPAALARQVREVLNTTRSQNNSTRNP